MFDLPLMQVDDSESSINKDVNLHQIWVKIDTLYFKVLFFISLFDYVVSILEFNIVDSWTEYS